MLNAGRSPLRARARRELLAERPVGAEPEGVIGLHELVNLARAFVDDRALAVAIKAPDRVFVGIAIGAVDLHRVAGPAHQLVPAIDPQHGGGDVGDAGQAAGRFPADLAGRLVERHFASPVSRVLRRPLFFRKPARSHSSRAAW